MTSYEAYTTYLAFKLHFKTDTYNFFTYNGHVKTSVKAYEKRNDRYFFEKAASAMDRDKYLLKMLAEQKTNPGFIVKDILDRSNELEYMKIKGYLESFLENFKKEISFVRDRILIDDSLTFKDFILPTSVNKNIPLFLKMYLKPWNDNIVSPETVIGLNVAIGFLKNIDPILLNNPVWTEHVKYFNKYQSFIQASIPEKTSLKNILFDLFSKI